MRALCAPTAKPVTLAALHPNPGLAAAYARRLVRLVDEMHASLTHWLLAAYRRDPPAPALAQDDIGSRTLESEMDRLGDKWLARFDQLAPDLAAWFATSAVDRSDAVLAAALKRGGFSIEFKMTPAVRDVFDGTLNAQVALITNIPQQHLAAVRGMVNRSVQTGGDLGGLAKALETQLGISKRRAGFIARSQNGIANATITRARQLEIGVTTAIWGHSGGGRHPRPEHVAASGKSYDVRRGMFLEGVWTWPGVRPNCRCVGKSVIPGLQ